MKNLKLMLALALLSSSVAVVAMFQTKAKIEQAAHDDDEERTEADEGYEPAILNARALAGYMVDNNWGVSEINDPESLTDEEVVVIANAYEQFMDAYKTSASKLLSTSMRSALNDRIRALGGFDKIAAATKAEGQKATEGMQDIGFMFEEKEAPAVKRSVPMSGYTVVDVYAVKIPAGKKNFDANGKRQLRKIFNAAIAARDGALAKAVRAHAATEQEQGMIRSMDADLKAAGL